MLSTCHVTRLGDAGGGIGMRGDLRYCINKVNDLPGPDIIEFKVTGTIELGSALPDLASDIELQGPGPDVLTIDANYKSRVFAVTPLTSVQIFGLSMFQGRSDRGAGIYNSGNLLVSHSRLSFNRAKGEDNAYGAGIYNTDIGTLTISSSAITENAADSFQYFNGAYGGGIYNLGTAIVDFSTIGGNSAVGRGSFPIMAEGAGIANQGDLTLRSSTVAGNQLFAEGYYEHGYVYIHGGGIANSGTARISNSTVNGNLAFIKVSANYGTPRLSLGAGIYTNGPLMIANSTVAANDAAGIYGGAGQGGGIFGSVLSLHNSIVALNSVSGSYLFRKGPDLCGSLTWSGYNLIGEPRGGRGYDASDLLDVDPSLGPLADNGGPTLTRALLPGSPAIDAGDNTDAPEFDQRGPGFPRIVNGTIDIGAFEVQATDAPLPAPRARRGSPDPAVFITADLNTDEPNWRM